MKYNNYKEMIIEENESLKNVHSHLQHLSTNKLKDICDKDRNPFSVCLLNITGNLNIGMMIRTASIFGATRVFILGRNVYDKRSTVGADKYIEVIRRRGPRDTGIDFYTFYDIMKSYNMVPIFIEQGGKLLSDLLWDNIITNFHPCLVLGTEKEGIPFDILEYGKIYDPRSFIVSVPQKGVIRSLNVSSAASIVIFDMCMGKFWV